VYYFDRLLAARKAKKPIPDSNPLLLMSITLHAVPKVVREKGVEMFFELESQGTTYNSKGRLQGELHQAEDSLVFLGNSATGIASVDHDVQVNFMHTTTTGKQKMFAFWFNTRFLELDEESGTYKLILKKKELDKACKDKKHKLYSDVFRVELIFGDS